MKLIFICKCYKYSKDLLQITALLLVTNNAKLGYYRYWYCILYSTILILCQGEWNVNDMTIIPLKANKVWILG